MPTNDCERNRGLVVWDGKTGSKIMSSLPEVRDPKAEREGRCR
jgi:hypothetical protein